MNPAEVQAADEVSGLQMLNLLGLATAGAYVRQPVSRRPQESSWPANLLQGKFKRILRLLDRDSEVYAPK